MSVATYKADAWICVFERLPPPHPDEVRLVRGLGREAFVAVCVTVEREVRRIVFLDQTINVPHAQVLLSELDPENREIVFVAAPTIIRLLLTQWEMVTKVKRVVHDKVPPFVPGSYIPVTDYGRDALVELVSQPTLPKGFVAAVRRRVGQRWRSVHSPVIPVPNDIRPFLCEFGLWQTVHHPSGSFTQRIQPTAERQQLPVAAPTPAVFPSAAVPPAAAAVFPNNRIDQNPINLSVPASANSSTPSTRIEQCFGVAPTAVPNIFGARSFPARPRPQPSAAIVPSAGYFVFSGPSKTEQRQNKKTYPVVQRRGPWQAPQGRRAADGWTTQPKDGKVEPKKKFQAQKITPPDATSSSTPKSGTSKNSRKRLVKQQPREENKAERRPKPRDSSDARRGPKGDNSTRESAPPVVKKQPVATRTDDEPSKENTKEQEYLAYKRLRNRFRRKRRGGRQQSARRGTAAARAASAPQIGEDLVDEGGADSSGLPPVADIAMELSDAPAAPEPVASLPVVSTHTEDAAPATAESSPAVGLPEKMVCDDDGVLDGASEGSSMDSEEEEKILAGEQTRARRVINTRDEIMKITIASAVANEKLQQRQAEDPTLPIFGVGPVLAKPPLVPIDAMAPPLEILLPSGVESVSGTPSVPDPLNQPASVPPAAPRSGDPLTTASSAPVPVESDRGYSVPSAENIALTQVTSTIAEMKVDEQAAAPGTSKVHQVDEVVVAAPSVAEPLQPLATAVDPPVEPPVYGSRDYRETNKDETEEERLAKIQKYKDDYHLKHGYPKGKGKAGGRKTSQGKKSNPKQAAMKSNRGRPTASQSLNSRIRVQRRNQDQSQQPSASVQDEQHPPPSARPEAAASPIQRDAGIPTVPGAAGYQPGGPDPARLSLEAFPEQVDAPPTAANIPTSSSSAGVIPPDDNAGNFDAFFAPPKPSA